MLPLFQGEITAVFILRCLLIIVCTGMLAGCAALVGSATSGMAGNLSSAILNQDDPETVRDGAPAYLLMLDGFVEGAPNDVAMLGATAELYALYGTVFVADQERAKRLTAKARFYAQRALCARNDKLCGIQEQPYNAFVHSLDELGSRDLAVLYTYGLTWIAYIQAHRADWSALARLPEAEAILLRVKSLDSSYQESNVEHYLAVLKTIRPPALGGKFEEGRAHYERAIALSGDRDLSIKVDYANYYARTLYDRELHDRLLDEVLTADPLKQGYTLFNTLAQREARILLDSADDYF